MEEPKCLGGRRRNERKERKQRVKGDEKKQSE
jgi:hypothetical protein